MRVLCAGCWGGRGRPEHIIETLDGVPLPRLKPAAKSPDCRSQNVIALIAIAFIVLVVVCLIVTGAK